jgi:PASTA domain
MFSPIRPPGRPVRVVVVSLLLWAGLAAGCGGSGGPDAHGRAALDALSTPTGPTTIVPRLLGLRERRALPLARRAGLIVRPSFQGSLGNPSVESGCVQVVSQSPPPGARRPRGSQIGISFGVCHGRIGPGKARALRHHFGTSAH